MDVAETTDEHWKAVSLLFNSLVSSAASTQTALKSVVFVMFTALVTTQYMTVRSM